MPRHQNPPLFLPGVIQRNAVQYVWHQFGCRFLSGLLLSLSSSRGYPQGSGAIHQWQGHRCWTVGRQWTRGLHAPGPSCTPWHF